MRSTTPLEGRRSFRGVLADAASDSITLELEGGERVTLPLAALAKATVVYDFTKDGGRRE